MASSSLLLLRLFYTNNFLDSVSVGDPKTGCSVKFVTPSDGSGASVEIKEAMEGKDEICFDGKEEVTYEEGDGAKLALLSVYMCLKYKKYTEQFKACKGYGLKAVTSGLKDGLMNFFENDKGGSKGEDKGGAEGKDKERKKGKRKASAGKDKGGRDGGKKKRPAKEAVTSAELLGKLNTAEGTGEGQEQTMPHFSFLEVGDLKAQNDKVEENRPAVTKISLHETPVATTTALLKAVDPTKDLNIALQYFEAPKKGRGGREDKSGKAAASASKSKKTKIVGNPIIVVPNAMTATINMANAQEFFGNANFVDPNSARRKKGYSKPKSLEVLRRMAKNNKEVTFEIIDDAKRLRGKDWDRVVAVLAQGKEWQFKGWEKSDPVDVFTHAFGFHVYVEGAPVPEMLANWAVKISKVNRDKRGLDSVTHSQFWTNLEAWMKVHRPAIFD